MLKQVKSDYVMPFGKYEGKTLNEIANTDKGLLYLDWCVREWPVDNAKTLLKIQLRIQEYLSEPTIQRKLDVLLERSE